MENLTTRIDSFLAEESSDYPVNILLVDDKPENLYSLKKLLQLEGKNINFILCTSGEEALKVAIKSNIALILLDVQMPAMDGYEVAIILKASLRTQNIPIIFVTANDREIDNVVEGFNVGAIDFLFKPLNPQITRAKVKAFIKLFQRNEMLNSAKQELLLINESLKNAVQQKTKELAQSDNKFIAVFQNAASGIIIISPNGECIDCNAKFEQIVGYEKGELYGRSLKEITFSKDVELEVQAYDTLISGQSKEYILVKRYVHKKGNIVYVNAAISSVWHDSELEYFIAVIEDITQQKVLEQEQQKYVSLVQNSQDFIAIADLDGRIKFVNNAGLILVGLKDLQEAQNTFLSDYIHPDDRSRVGQKGEILFNTGDVGTEVRYINFVTKEEIPVYFNLVIINDPIAKNPISIATVTHDLRERKLREAELAKINEALETKNRQLKRLNNDLDDFIYSVSHDLKAPINNVDALIASLVDSLPEEIRNAEELTLLNKMIKESIGRFKSIMKELTEIAKTQDEDVLDFEDVAFEEIYNEVIAVVKDQINESEADIKADFSRVPSISFSTKNIRSIFYNLISNAVKYRSPLRSPSIEVRSEMTDNGEIKIVVSDNGLGIREEDYENVFKMFRRLHTHVEGTGVGMHLVKRILDNAGGRIEINSEVGIGSTFTIFLRDQ